MFVTAAVLAVVASTPLEDGWSWRRGDLEVVDGRVVSPETGWELLEGSGTLRRKATDDVTMWLRRMLPSTIQRDEALSLTRVIGHFEIFVGGERIYLHPKNAGVDGHGMNGLEWHLVTLPADAAGKELLIRVRSTYALAGIQGTPELVTRADYFENLVREDTPRFVIGCLLCMLAVLFFIALRSDRRLAFALSSYALSAGVYVLFYTRLKQVLLPVPAPLWLFLYVLALATTPTAFLFMIESMFDTKSVWIHRMKNWHLWGGAFTVVTSLAMWVLLAVTDSPSAGVPVGFAFFAVTLSLRALILITTTWILLLLVRWSLGRGEVSDVPRARILLVGMLVLFVAVWLNVIASTGIAGAPNYVPLGMLSVSLTLATLAQRAWRESHQRALVSEKALTQRTQEKEAMLRDLHDGIGSVTTNIRMLAELGQRDEKRAVQSLATIAELSSEGIAELRTFIQSLDENQVDWNVLSSELRRFGGQLIESQGMQFQLDAELSESAPPPTGAVTLALLRIFREALTNIVKHAAAKEVRVKLVVTASALTLEVRDDGEGHGEGGGTGRGLRNMRARAEELGGQFQFQRDAGARVSIALPLVH